MRGVSLRRKRESCALLAAAHSWFRTEWTREHPDNKRCFGFSTNHRRAPFSAAALEHNTTPLPHYARQLWQNSSKLASSWTYRLIFRRKIYSFMDELSVFFDSITFFQEKMGCLIIFLKINSSIFLCFGEVPPPFWRFCNSRKG